MCDFYGEFRRFFCRGLHEFSRRLWFALDTFPIYRASWYAGDFLILKETAMLTHCKIQSTLSCAGTVHPICDCDNASETN